MNNLKYQLHNDFRNYNFVPPFSPMFIRLARMFQKPMLRATSVPADITVRRFTVPGFNGLNMPVEVFEPVGSTSSLPCLLYFHGGAFSYMASPSHKKLACLYVQKVGCKVVLPDYHLLPKYPFPAAQKDAISAYAWIYDNANELKIDKQRIAVGGDSAGGALATYVCAPTDMHKLPTPCFQMLIYPVTDASMQSDSMNRFVDTPIWNAKLNAKMWELYLKGATKEQTRSASPMQADLPLKIPDTYIETAEFDCLHDDGVAYAKRLLDAGGKVELYETVGTIHGYEIVLNSQITKDSVQKRIEALRAAFS